MNTHRQVVYGNGGTFQKWCYMVLGRMNFKFLCGDTHQRPHYYGSVEEEGKARTIKAAVPPVQSPV
jgi:hypothetical protein